MFSALSAEVPQAFCNFKYRVAALTCAVALAGCAVPVKSPLHLSFEDLGYASEDVGSLLSNKYRSVVNIAGLAPLASVGSLHNRPQRYAYLNPIRFFRQNSLPDYYSLALTTQCSKVMELVYDRGVTADDVWEVRKNVENLVRDAQTGLAQLTRKRMALALVDAHAKAITAATTLKADQLSSPPEKTAAIAEEMVLRSMLLRLLGITGTSAGLQTELKLETKQAQALVSPDKANLGDYQAGMQALNKKLEEQAKALPAPSEADVASNVKSVNTATAAALRKGILVTRWSAESLSEKNAGLGNILGKQVSEGRMRQGFLVMGGIRLAQIMLGDDFLEYRANLKRGIGVGIDHAVSDQFMVLYTIGAKHRTFFEEASNDLLERFRLNLDASQVSRILDLPISSNLKSMLDLLKEQSVSLQSALTALVSAGEQGFLQAPRTRLYDFRFNTPELLEKSMLAEKVRTAAYTPIYSVRADVVQADSQLIDGTSGTVRNCDVTAGVNFVTPMLDELHPVDLEKQDQYAQPIRATEPASEVLKVTNQEQRKSLPQPNPANIPN